MYLESHSKQNGGDENAATQLKFVDLFAGLGGFHQALAGLGHTCVLASEIDGPLRELYKKNFGIEPVGDIRDILDSDVPKHDLLCGGFPCQPYSKAGDQQGLDCPRWGGLIEEVLRILRASKPRLLLLENVPNLVRHDDGKTWNYIRDQLESIGYDVAEARLSPHKYGIPQIRERTLIVGRMGGKGALGPFAWPAEQPRTEQGIRAVLDRKPKDAVPLPPHFIKYLETWQALIDKLPADEPLPTWPLWAMEFGATYPYQRRTPYAHNFRLGGKAGALGKSLSWLSADEVKAALPSYARVPTETFPDWKIEFIRLNREFYTRHQKIIDKWLPKIRGFAPSFQKLEWNAKGSTRDIWQHVIQFRASGIRVKVPTKAPTLVAFTSSQVPVIAWERRYMTPRECARLQSMGGLAHLPESRSAAYKALGNAVNVHVVSLVAQALISADRTMSLKAKTSEPDDLAA